MPRLRHGSVIAIEQVEAAVGQPTALVATLGLPGIATEFVSGDDVHKFGFLFDSLQGDAENLLPEDPATVESLKALGDSTREHNPERTLDSTIPAAMTYLGQFIDHDITLEAASAKVRGGLNNPNLAPLTKQEVEEGLVNLRTATLDLDSVYGSQSEPTPREGDRLLVGKVFPLKGTHKPLLRPLGKDDLNDLPREPRSEDGNTDRAARTGDPRNDENLIIAQLHTAFLRAHNAIIQKNKSTFEQARTTLRKHYQWLIIHDFLKRIVGDKLVDDILTNGPKHYPVKGRPFFLPLEFTVAAYRFGHSMVRHQYDHNVNFPEATLLQLFTFTALSGNISPRPDPLSLGTDTLPDNWIIEWEQFVETGRGVPANRARRIETRITDPLFILRDSEGNPLRIEPRLAVRNLLRGYLLRMPTGQAVARAMGETPLTPEQLKAIAVDADAAQGKPAEGEPAFASQAEALESAGFLDRTPLWYYVLAEAAHFHKGEHLGPVAGRIVAEVFIELVKRSEDSIFPDWKPTLGQTPGQFTLVDLLRISGNL